MSATTIVILAAGASTRMRGADKLLAEVDGAPLLRVLAERALATGVDVAVTLSIGSRGRARAKVLPSGILRIEVADAVEGMSASLRAVARELADRDAILILPGDMPEITADDLSRMIAAVDADPEAIHRATSVDGVPGHPVVIPRRITPELLELSGDAGARDILRRRAGEVRLHPLPDRHALTDLDTPEEWEAWRERN